MTGVLFIVNIPCKDHETDLKEKARSAKLVMEDVRYQHASTLIRELKGDKRFGKVKSTFESDGPREKYNNCRSTECVYDDGDLSLYKSKSDNALNESYKLAIGACKFRKKSWGDLMLGVTRKKKVRITQPPSLTDILTAFHEDTPLETVLSEVFTRLDICNATWTATEGNKYWQVLFSLDSSYLCEELLQVLRSFGIGFRYQSSLSVVPCALHYKADRNRNEADQENYKNNNELHSGSDSAWARFSSSVRARTNLAQVLHDVRADAALTFDWLFLLVVAAFVAAIGLVENSTVILVASMLISPLMGPITAGTLGTAVRDRSLQVMGVLHELLGLFLALVIGFLFGLTICAVDERYGAGEWPTYEMMARCEIRSLWVGVLVAIPSGAGVALAVLGENTPSLVGVAISASLLPPAVNAGLLWAMALVHMIFAADATRWTGVLSTYSYSNDQPTELAVLGALSLGLTLVNIACIFVTGVIVYKSNEGWLLVQPKNEDADAVFNIKSSNKSFFYVKKVRPLDRSSDILWWRANTSSRSHHSPTRINNNITWEKYNNCSNGFSKSERDEEPHHLVQSDTVTFRHETPAIRRMKAQNIEAYCLQKQPFSSLPNNIEPNAQDGHHIYNSIENAPTLKSDMSLQVSNNMDLDFLNKNRITDLDNVVSFCNDSFEDQENFIKSFERSIEDSSCPVIEPSLNYTVDTKNHVVLGSKSYNV